MSQLKSLDLPEQGGAGASPRATSPPGSRAWIWLVVLGIVIVGGFWYYRSAHSKSQDSASAAPGGAGGSGKGKGAGGGYAVPVVVATAQSGDLPVFFNGLGS